MSGIYIHIPFCKSKCHYCDFYSVTKSDGMDGFSSVLLQEMDHRCGYLDQRNIDTVYFGGGTPTLPHPLMIGTVLDKLRALFLISPDAEITIEANPDDLTPDKLKQYLEMGINRISIGIQSFNDEHLRFMNRRHDAASAIISYKMAREAGFGNISLDLIYGIPGMTLRQWEDNLLQMCELKPEHISAYHLTIEPGTYFGRLKKSGLFAEIPDEESISQYRMLMDILDAGGYEQYEISNFARDGRYSRHNTKYWTGDSYIGLGPSAHSFNGSQRHWNPSSLSAYTGNIRKGTLPEGEIITPEMKRNEYVMTRLRTAAGIRSDDFIRIFGEPAWADLKEMAALHIRSGRLLFSNGTIRFDRLAWFQSDTILSDLFLIS